MRYQGPLVGRRLPRRVATIDCQAVRLSDFRLIADRIIDVSPSGLLLSPSDPVLTGDAMIVAFRAPYWGRWVDIEATVARVIHGRRPGDATRAVALSIDSMSQDARFVFEQAMRWMPPVPPRTRPGRRSTRDAVRRLVLPLRAPVVRDPAGFST